MPTKHELEKALNANRACFLRYLDRARSTGSLLRYFYGKKAIRAAVMGSTGVYFSKQIEDIFIALAKKIKVKLPEKYKPNSVLHVVTECYGVGGHSRVVERWITYRQPEETHSIYFTRMKIKNVPEIFKELVRNSSGQIYSGRSRIFDIIKAIHLRRLAMNYERVILHVHMYDVVPLIAFGSDDFNRTVILYNHADHLFWVGAQLPHLICETRNWGERFTKNMRGCDNSYVLGIPASGKQPILSEKVEASYAGRKIITSIGMPHKYFSVPECNYFYDYMVAILKTTDDVEFRIIGPTFDDFPEWKALSTTYDGRLHVLGKVTGKAYNEYINESLIVVDSFPMSGGTALSDVVSMRKPVLSLDCVTGHLDYTYRSPSYCQTMDELIALTHRLLTDDCYRSAFSAETYKVFIETENISSWQVRVKNTYELADKYKEQRQHRITDVMFDHYSHLDYFTLLFNTRMRKLLSISRFISISMFNRNGRRTFEFKFLGLKITL